MDLSFKHGRRHTQVLSLWAWFCFVLLGSSLTYSQSTLTWNAQPSNQTVEKGATVTFRCSAYYGGKALEYHWLKDGGNIQTDSLSRFSIQDDGTLEITSTQLDDRGEYNCYVKRQGRTKTLGHSKSATLSVDTGLCSAVQLSIKPDVGGYTFLAGTYVQLRCKCYMNPPGTYTFTKDGSSVTTGSRVTIDRNKLYLKNATESDSGEYSCRATSADSLQTVTPTKNLPISVVVGQHPRFQLPPPTKSVVLEGSQVDIPCQAIGKPEPLIKWYAGSDTSPLQNGSKYNIAADGTLQIKNVGKRDAQTYNCKAENLVGTVVKDTVVELAYLDPVTVEKEKVYVLVNERTEVHCNKPSGSPEPNITWEKEGGEKLSERFGVEGCCTLLNNRTRRKDAGKYTCTASNVYRSSHVNVEIIVLAYPIFAVRPKNTTAFVNQDVWLHCNASGEPKPYIIWSKEVPGGYKLDPKRFIQYPNGTLHIKEVHFGDKGHYYCIAANHAGTKQSKFSLDVHSDVSTSSYVSTSLSGEVSTSSYVSTSLSEMSEKATPAIAVAVAYLCLHLLVAVVCRWRLKQRKKETSFAPLNPDFKFDAFIIYSTVNQKWVTDELLPTLESKHNIKCCIHYRDFVPGVPFTKNMADCVYNSRKTVAVVSKSFLASNFCSQEMSIALHRLAERGDDSVVVVKLDDVKNSQLPKELRFRSYIDFTKSTDKRTWEHKLVNCLKSGTKSVTTIY